MRFSTVLVLLALIAVSGFIYVGYREPSFSQQLVLEIDAPVERTFAVLKDPEQLPFWIAGFRKIEYLRGEENQPGSYYRITLVEDNRELIMTEHLTDLIENEHFAAEFETEMMTSKSDYWFEPTERGTRVTSNSEFAGNGPFWRSVLWFSKADIKARQQADLDRFKVLVERNPTALD
jgi:uncharacterized protein YndB with AHSA1/START domain